MAEIPRLQIQLLNQPLVPQNNTVATPTQTVSLTTIPVFPTQIPTLTANWKTYTNAKWGISFKYPETWFPQEAPQSSQQGDAVNFYPNGVTPDPGGGGETPFNSVFSVENQDWPAIRGVGYNGEQDYIPIKLTSNSELVFGPHNEDAAKSLDTIISTIKFTDQNQPAQSTNSTLLPADSQYPAAGVCASPPIGDTAVFDIKSEPDNAPQPRCQKVSGNQKLQLLNDTDKTLQFSLGQYTMTVSPGKSQTLPVTFGSFLMPGVHQYKLSPYLGPELWLQQFRK